MNKEIEYKLYKHKQTDKIVKACKFKFGMEDGKIEITKNNYKPYINAWDMGYKQKIFVCENDYIVLNTSFSKKYNKEVEYKFIFNKKLFLKFYKRVEE